MKIYDLLREYKALLDNGAITEEEFEKKKRELLGMPEKPVESVEIENKLDVKEYLDQGVQDSITESKNEPVVKEEDSIESKGKKVNLKALAIAIIAIVVLVVVIFPHNPFFTKTPTDGEKPDPLSDLMIEYGSYLTENIWKVDVYQDGDDDWNTVNAAAQDITVKFNNDCTGKLHFYENDYGFTWDSLGEETDEEGDVFYSYTLNVYGEDDDVSIKYYPDYEEMHMTYDNLWILFYQ